MLVVQSVRPFTFPGKQFRFETFEWFDSLKFWRCSKSSPGVVACVRNCNFECSNFEGSAGSAGTGPAMQLLKPERGNFSWEVMNSDRRLSIRKFWMIVLIWEPHREPHREVLKKFGAFLVIRMHRWTHCRTAVSPGREDDKYSWRRDLLISRHL